MPTVELNRHLTISSPKALSAIKIKIAEIERHCTLGGCNNSNICGVLNSEYAFIDVLKKIYNLLRIRE